MASLQIPIGLWRGFLELNVSCVHASVENRWLFLGTQSGRIIQLHFDPDKEDEPSYMRMLLHGHYNPVVSMAITEQKSDQSDISTVALLSLDSRGEASLWSLDDGRCLLHNMMSIDGQALGMTFGSTGEFAYIYGLANFINVLKVSTLEIIQSVPILVWPRCCALRPGHASDELFLFPIDEDYGPFKIQFDHKSGKTLSAAVEIPVSEDYIFEGHSCVTLPNNEIIFSDDDQSIWSLDVHDRISLIYKCENSSIKALLLAEQHAIVIRDDSTFIRLSNPPEKFAYTDWETSLISVRFFSWSNEPMSLSYDPSDNLQVQRLVGSQTFSFATLQGK